MLSMDISVKNTVIYRTHKLKMWVCFIGCVGVWESDCMSGCIPVVELNIRSTNLDKRTIKPLT